MNNEPQSVEPSFCIFWFNDFNPLSGLSKKRLIHNPNPAMRGIHANMIRYVRQLKIPMPNSTACRRGQSALKNVLCHRKLRRTDFNRYFFLADISSAYRAVSLERMVKLFFETNFILIGVKFII